MSYLVDLGVTIPVIQAPMAGGATTVNLVVAVCRAGALGSLAAGMLNPIEIEQQIKQIRQQTDRAFMVNLFVPSAATIALLNEPRPAWEIPLWLAKLYQDKGMEQPKPTTSTFSFREQFAAVLATRPAVASFTFGILTKEQVTALKERSIGVVGTVNHPEEAKAWADLDADALIVQGYEAGGHRGGFLQESVQNVLSLMPLLSLCRQVVATPLWATGGIMTGSEIAAAQIMGAEAAQMGTAFLTTKESGIPEAYKLALLNTQKQATRQTRLFSGKSARGLVNQMMQDFESYEQDVLPYPIQNIFTLALRKKAAANNDTDYMSLWAGEGVSLSRDMSVAELITALKTEYQQAIAHFKEKNFNQHDNNLN